MNGAIRFTAATYLLTRCTSVFLHLFFPLPNLLCMTAGSLRLLGKRVAICVASLAGPGLLSPGRTLFGCLGACHALVRHVGTRMVGGDYEGVSGFSGTGRESVCISSITGGKLLPQLKGPGATLSLSRRT